MIYGTLTKARKYDEKGEINQWLQLFLRNDGKNIALADDLLLEPRYYLGIKRISIQLLEAIQAGTPEYLHDEDSIRYFFYIVDKMKADYTYWDTPPLIISYDNGIFHVDDGRHRLEMYRQLNAEYVHAILWTTGEENYRKLLEVLE